MEEYNQNSNYSTNNFNHEQEGILEGTSARNVSLVRIYLYLGLGLLITFALSVLVPLLIKGLASAVGSDVATNVYIGILIVGGICLLVSAIMVNLPFWRKAPKFILPGYIAYSSSVGVLLSLLVWLVSDTVGGYTVTISFLITAVCFMGMGLIGILTKKDLNVLWPLLASICFGILIICLVNFFMQLEMVYWIIDFVMFGVMLIIIAIDIQNVTRQANEGLFDNDKSACVYAAYVLYGDFISIFVRILLYVAIFASKRK